MKKWIKGLTVAGIIMLCAGTGITALAAAAGGVGTYNKHRFPMEQFIGRVVDQSTHGIFGYGEMIESSWEDHNDYDFDDYLDSYSTDDSYDEDIVISPKEEMVLAGTYKGIKNLDLEISGSIVKVVENAALTDEIAIYVKEKEKTGVHHNLKQGTSLSVEYYTKNRDPYRNGIYGEGIIEIPVGYKFNEAEVSVEAGDLNIASIEADDLNLSAQASNIFLTSFEAGQFSAEAQAAAIMGAGEVSDKMEIDAEAGSVELLLAGSKGDYVFNLNNAMGEITVGGDTYSGVSVLNNTGNGKKAELNCSVGTIKINFTK